MLFQTLLRLYLRTLLLMEWGGMEGIRQREVYLSTIDLLSPAQRLSIDCTGTGRGWPGILKQLLQINLKDLGFRSTLLDCIIAMLPKTVMKSDMGR